MKLLADLVELHTALYGNKLPFGFGINSPQGWQKLCTSPNGLFARGPKRIIDMYQKCLNKNGIKTSFLNEIAPNKKQFRLLLFGDSYFIAESFLFQRLE
jgi:hypothetical protein